MAAGERVQEVFLSTELREDLAKLDALASFQLECVSLNYREFLVRT